MTDDRCRWNGASNPRGRRAAETPTSKLSPSDNHPRVLDGVIMCGPRPPSEADLEAVREFGLWLDLRARKHRARERGEREEAGCPAEGPYVRNPDHLHICTGPEDHPYADGHACVCGDWWHDR